MDLDIKVPQVIFVRNSTDAWDSVYTRSVSDNISGARSVDYPTYGSAIRRSVSFTILLGSAAIVRKRSEDIGAPR